MDFNLILVCLVWVGCTLDEHLQVNVCMYPYAARVAVGNIFADLVSPL